MPENTIGLKEMDSTSMNSAIHLNSPDKQKQQQQQQQQQQDWIDSPTALEHSWPHPTTPFPMQRQRQRQRGFLTRIDKKIVWEYAVHWRWLWASIAFSLCMGAIMFHYRRELLQTLESLSKTVKGMGASGYLLIAGLIFLSAFPPMIGYGTYQTLSGYTFGFARGYPISYISALLGAITCFLISRIWLKERVQRIMKNYPNLEAVVKAVEKRGFKLFVLIRLSPYPFNLLNVMFAATNISFTHFALGTALTLTKIGLHIYIGANLTSFAKHVLGEEDEITDEERKADIVRYIAAIIGSVLAFGVMSYVYVVAKRAVKEVNDETEDSEETRAFLGAENDEEEALESWLEWDESESGSDHELSSNYPEPLSKSNI